jgi:hypothetical protein
MESKKAIYGLFACVCVLFVFAISAFLILTHAEVAKDITELANLCVMAFAALATTLITGQAVVDFKGMSVLQHISDDQKIDSNAEAPDVEVNQRVVKPRYFDSNDR